MRISGSDMFRHSSMPRGQSQASLNPWIQRAIPVSLQSTLLGIVDGILLNQFELYLCKLCILDILMIFLLNKIVDVCWTEAAEGMSRAATASLLLTSFDMWYNRGHYLHALQHSAWQHGRARFQRLRLLGEYQGNSGYSDVIGSVGHSWPDLGLKNI